jgi:hypothetical protein
MVHELPEAERPDFGGHAYAFIDEVHRRRDSITLRFPVGWLEAQTMREPHRGEMARRRLTRDEELIFVPDPHDPQRYEREITDDELTAFLSFAEMRGAPVTGGTTELRLSDLSAWCDEHGWLESTWEPEER